MPRLKGDTVKNQKEQSCLEKKCLEKAREQLSIKNCFALPQAEFENIKKYVQLAKLNGQRNEFPDFLFPGGFIEHFKITSAPESQSKGSAHIRGISNFHQKCDQKMKEMAVATQAAEFFDAYQYKRHSHSNLTVSFKRNWESHIDSLRNTPKFDGHIGVFMVHYCDKALKMHGQPPGASDMKLSHEDIEMIDDYSLSRDQKLLQYLRNYRGVIKYVIFVNSIATEVISIDSIEIRLEQLQAWDYIFCPHPFAMELYWGSSTPAGEGGEAE